ncbi:interleukin-5 [Echinops telfairi]|uniref:Interleukin-5 n=1 Tax=Echinops telfairi TaxID=9371 RepID=A0ABM0ICN4_ECHTE|nr:interleukin-5 [Echinops telfairi]
MRTLLHLSLLALGAACTCALAIENPVPTLVTETLKLLSTHGTLLIGNGTLRILTPAHKEHRLCVEEVFQGIDTLKNQTIQDSAVEKLFKNLSLLREHMDLQKKKCKGERRKVKQFLDYLQEFLKVININHAPES